MKGFNKTFGGIKTPKLYSFIQLGKCYLAAKLSIEEFYQVTPTGKFQAADMFHRHPERISGVKDFFLNTPEFFAFLHCLCFSWQYLWIFIV